MGLSTGRCQGQGKNKNTRVLQNGTKAGSLLSDQAGESYPTCTSCLWDKLTFFRTTQKRTQVPAAN